MFINYSENLEELEDDTFDEEKSTRTSDENRKYVNCKYLNEKRLHPILGLGKITVRLRNGDATR